MTCSLTEFSKLINRSVQAVEFYSENGYVVRLRGYPVIFIYDSLNRYFSFVRYTYGRLEMEIQQLETLDRVSKQKIKPRKQPAIRKALEIKTCIDKTEKQLKLLRYFCTFTDVASLPSVGKIAVANKKLREFQSQFFLAQEEVKNLILSKEIKPVQCETILLARYVDCESFWEISEDYSYSLSHVYFLHRQGLKEMALRRKKRK